MKNYPLWKIFIVFILVSLGVVFAIPSILYQEDTGNWYLDNRLNLGLDLQGGSYLLLEVQTDVLIEEEFENFSDTVRIIARENRVKINNIERIDEELKVRFDSSEKLDDIRSSFLQNYRSVKFNISNNVASISIDQLYKKSIQDSAIKQSLEIVRKISFLLNPIIPDSSLKALKIFNLSQQDIKLQSISNNEFLTKGMKINKIDILFKKIEKKND